MSEGSDIIWFRSDLRLSDNEAVYQASRTGRPLVAVYIYSPEDEGRWSAGTGSRWYLHHALAALAASLERAGSRLILRRGPAATTLTGLARETGARRVFWNRCVEPAARATEDSVTAALEQMGVAACSFHSCTLIEPQAILSASRSPYRVFTPFWNALIRWQVPGPRPRVNILPPPVVPQSLPLPALNLLTAVGRDGGFASCWQAGEDQARSRLDSFLAGAVGSYEWGRDRPDLNFSSRLSPHIHFGEIGVRTIWHEVMRLLSESHGHGGGAWQFLKEIAWREFASHLLYHFPETVDEPLRREFAAFPCQDNDSLFAAWQKGLTGYPLVDAGMRELWYTGWMHNRLRMIVASFLVKDLLIPWQKGAAFFWDRLVDADLANNTLGWQWTAGCGADAAPYFRMFNPVLQGERFDPEGNYVRKWVPELTKVPSHLLHRPWQADTAQLRSWGIVLGQSYPHRIVDHGWARTRAMAALAEMNARTGRGMV